MEKEKKVVESVVSQVLGDNDLEKIAGGGGIFPDMRQSMYDDYVKQCEKWGMTPLSIENFFH